MAAAEAGDPAGTEQAAHRLETRFRACAKDISTKYISPPDTTEYAVMYVPSEGLYAEIVKRPGLISAITREFNVVVAGPKNLMAILNAVHAVSRSVDIQHKAGEIAALLLKVQGEFVKYGAVVSIAKRRAESTVKAMESLDTRQRAMGRALRDVRSIEGIAATAQLTGPVFDLPIDEIADDDADDELSYMNEADKIAELRTPIYPSHLELEHGQMMMLTMSLRSINPLLAYRRPRTPLAEGCGHGPTPGSQLVPKDPLRLTAANWASR